MEKILNIYQYFIKSKYYIILLYNKNLINMINISWDEKFNYWYVIFFIIIVISSLGVLLSRNPIHSVFFLIIVFLHISCLLLLLHVEFLAFLILIIYLGAIAVLFLFVIMMFNIHILESRDNILRYIPLIILIFGILIEISYITNNINIEMEIFLLNDIEYLYKNWYNLVLNKDNINVLSIIYNYYFYYFILASLILLIAMIGAIMLALNLKMELKNQNYYMQNNKNLYNSLVLQKQNTIKLEIWKLYLRIDAY